MITTYMHMQYITHTWRVLGLITQTGNINPPLTCVVSIICCDVDMVLLICSYVKQSCTNERPSKPNQYTSIKLNRTFTTCVVFMDPPFVLHSPLSSLHVELVLLILWHGCIHLPSALISILDT